MVVYYGDRISPHMTDTPEGYLICHDVPIARTGPQDYLARELGLPGDPERIVSVQRHPEDVFEAAALASFEGKPVTDSHPPETVGPENYAAYAKGHVRNVRRAGERIVADLYIYDALLASDVRNGIKREVSCGYLCDYAPDGAGYRQAHIRGNHVAVVPRGRAGHDVAIQDHAAQAAEIFPAEKAEKGRKRMKKETKDALYRFFGLAANDAQPEELEQLTRDVSTVAGALDSDAAEEAAPPLKAAPAEDEAPAAKALDSKLDRILELLEGLLHEGSREEKKLADEASIDEAIQALCGDGAAAGSVTIPARDAAVELLKKVRPAVAAIRDEREKAAVADALLSAVRDKEVMDGIAKAALDSAKANAGKYPKASYEAMCAESEAAYAALNPHKRKEN